MENRTQLKALILKQILGLLDQKIEILLEDIASLKDARDNENKNSAGDIYETGREMMQIELEKNEIHLSKTLVLRKELSLIDTQKKFIKVEFGSLVFTNLGNYFMSIALGKVELNNETFHPISLNSPIGQVIQNKKINDRIQFQEKEITIIDIL